MNQIIKSSAACFLIAAFAFMPPGHHVIGHWRISYPNGSGDYLDLKPNGIFRNSNSEVKHFT